MTIDHDRGYIIHHLIASILDASIVHFRSTTISLTYQSNRKYGSLSILRALPYSSLDFDTLRVNLPNSVSKPCINGSSRTKARFGFACSWKIRSSCHGRLCFEHLSGQRRRIWTRNRSGYSVHRRNHIGTYTFEVFSTVVFDVRVLVRSQQLHCFLK
jgi:hypothetical protein